MTVESTTQALCDLALRFGEGDEESMVSNSTYLLISSLQLTFFFKKKFVFFLQSRPFGVSLLIAGHDENGPSL